MEADSLDFFSFAKMKILFLCRNEEQVIGKKFLPHALLIFLAEHHILQPIFFFVHLLLIIQGLNYLTTSHSHGFMLP